MVLYFHFSLYQSFSYVTRNGKIRSRIAEEAQERTAKDEPAECCGQTCASLSLPSRTFSLLLIPLHNIGGPKNCRFRVNKEKNYKVEK